MSAECGAWCVVRVRAEQIVCIVGIRRSPMTFVTPGGIKVTGAWTRAGFGSCVRVEGSNKLDDILFDCGVCEPECLRAGFVFISHGHVDHIGACIMHARAKMLTSRQSMYYVPTESVGPLEEARVAFSKMDGKDIPMNIIPVCPGDVVYINTDLIVKVFPTIHRVPSQGYALYKKSSGCLLEQYRHLSGKEIGELRRGSTKITSEDSESLELVYTGDTTFEGLLQPCNHFIFSSAILILELTYLDGDRKKAIDRGHIHLSDIIENKDLFQNDQIIFVHLSERYSPHSKALNMLRDGLPQDLLERSVVSLRSFGSGEHLTKISDVDWNKRRAEVGWGWGRSSRPPPSRDSVPARTTDNRSLSSSGVRHTDKHSDNLPARGVHSLVCNASDATVDFVTHETSQSTSQVTMQSVERRYRSSSTERGRGRGTGRHSRGTFHGRGRLRLGGRGSS